MSRSYIRELLRKNMWCKNKILNYVCIYLYNWMEVKYDNRAQVIHKYDN